MAKLTFIVEKFKQKKTEGGLFYALQRTIWTAVPKWLFDYNNQIAYRTDLQNRVKTAIGNENIRWAGKADAEYLMALGVDRKQVESAFDNGVRVAICERAGNIVAHQWCATIRHTEGGWLTYRLDPMSYMGTWIWVDPRERGRGLAQKLIEFCRSEFHKEGFSRTVGTINVLNRSSRRSSAKTGATPADHLFYIRFLGLTYMHYGSSRRFGFWNTGRPCEILLG